jgi:hypothetical protein
MLVPTAAIRSPPVIVAAAIVLAFIGVNLITLINFIAVGRVATVSVWGVAIRVIAVWIIVVVGIRIVPGKSETSDENEPVMVTVPTPITAAIGKAGVPKAAIKVCR